MKKALPGDKKKTKILLTVAVLTVTVAAVCAAVFCYLLFYRKSRGRVVTYPDLVGSLEWELPDLSGFDVERTYVYSDIYPRAVVISQSPEGISIRKTASEKPSLELRISLGREARKMPSLCGKSLAEARVALSGYQCRIKTIKVYGRERDTVIDSFPSVGSQIYAGDTVVLYVGAQRQTSTRRMPDLVGKTENEALELISDMGLDAEMCEAYDQNAELGRVISQSPPRDSVIVKGTRIKIYINTD